MGFEMNMSFREIW